MAASLKERFDIESKLVKGRSGVFEVTYEGELLYSKLATGRFPNSGEVEEVLAQRVA